MNSSRSAPGKRRPSSVYITSEQAVKAIISHLSNLNYPEEQGYYVTTGAGLVAALLG